jgi:hypothetical protein
MSKQLESMEEPPDKEVMWSKYAAVLAIIAIIIVVVLLLLATSSILELLRNIASLIIWIIESHFLIHVCWLLLSFLKRVLNNLSSVVHNIVSLFNLALDMALDGTRSKVLWFGGSCGATWNGLDTEVNHCAANLNCFVIAWDERGTLSN